MIVRPNFANVAYLLQTVDCTIFAALMCWIRWLAGAVYYYMVEAVEVVLKALVLAANAILSLLPQTNFEQPSLDSGVVGLLNYFVPIPLLLGAMTTVMVATAAYRVYVWGLRWAKAAD